MFLLLEEILAEGFSQHGQNSIIGEKQIVPFEELTSILVLGILFSEGCESQYLLNAGCVRGELFEEFLDPLFGFVLDNEAYFHLIESVLVLVLVFRGLEDFVEGMGDFDANGTS